MENEFTTIEAWLDEFFPRRKKSEVLTQLRSIPGDYANYIVDQAIREFNTSQKCRKGEGASARHSRK